MSLGMTTILSRGTTTTTTRGMKKRRSRGSSIRDWEGVCLRFFLRMLLPASLLRSASSSSELMTEVCTCSTFKATRFCPLFLCYFPPRSPSLSPFSHAHLLPHATIVTFECLKSGSQMRVAHKRNRHLRVLLWKWDTASRLSFRRTEHLLNSERNLPRRTNKYLCLKNQQKPFCFGVCFQSCVKMFLGLFEAQICSCDPPLVGAAGKRVSPCPHSNSERGEH